MAERKRDCGRVMGHGDACSGIENDPYLCRECREIFLGQDKDELIKGLEDLAGALKRERDLAHANMATMNTRVQMDARSYERDQHLIAKLREQLADASRLATAPWAAWADRVQPIVDAAFHVICHPRQWRVLQAPCGRLRNPLAAGLPRVERPSSSPIPELPCVRCEEDPELYEFRPCDHTPAPEAKAAGTMETRS